MSFLFFTDLCKKRSEYHCLLADQIMVYTSSIIYDRTTGMVVATGMAPRLSRLSIVQMESVKAEAAQRENTDSAFLRKELDRIGR